MFVNTVQFNLTKTNSTLMGRKIMMVFVSHLSHFKTISSSVLLVSSHHEGKCVCVCVRAVVFVCADGNNSTV